MITGGPDLVSSYVIEVHPGHSAASRARYRFSPDRFEFARDLFEQIKENQPFDVVLWCVEFEEAS